jgi:hypothetical protein
MNSLSFDRDSGQTAFTRFGLNRTELAAAILAELEGADDGRDPASVASAVASAIEANNEQLRADLSQMLRTLGQ